jgi:hypothetical protein
MLQLDISLMGKNEKLQVQGLNEKLELQCLTFWAEADEDEGT